MKGLTSLSYPVKLLTCMLILQVTLQLGANCQQQQQQQQQEDSQPATSNRRPGRGRRPNLSENNDIASQDGSSQVPGSGASANPVFSTRVGAGNQRNPLAGQASLDAGLSVPNRLPTETSESMEDSLSGSLGTNVNVNNRRRNPMIKQPATQVDEQQQQQQQQPTAMRPIGSQVGGMKRRKGTTSKPSAGSKIENILVDQNEYESGDCEDEDEYYRRGSYHNLDDYHDDEVYALPGIGGWPTGIQFIRNPARQFSRLIEDALDQVPDFSYGGRTRSSNSLSASSASAFNSDPSGYSRIQSSVTKNGKTKGIVTETRNGRTQTKRFGDSEETDEEAEESQDY